MEIKAIETDRSPEKPEYEQTCTVWVVGGAYDGIRYVETTEGEFVTQVIDRHGVVDDLVDEFDCGFDEFALEAVSVFSKHIRDATFETWELELLAGTRRPSVTNLSYE